MLVLELLKWAAVSPGTSAERMASMLAEGHEREVRWVLDAGLGPMLYRATREHFDYVPSALRDVLLSSDLTAQVRHGCVIDTANEVIDVCRELGTPVTLLKGISVSDQYYPCGHLRPMGDIDVLIAREAGDSVESALVRRGYRSDKHHPRNEDLHHAPPLLQPDRNVWVELHTKLFPAREELADGNLFTAHSITAHSAASMFQQRPVRRLTAELQIAYIASSWMRDLTLSGVSPSFLASLLDAIYLLNKVGTTLDWNGLILLVDNETAMASLYVTLAYIERHDLCVIPGDVLSALRARQRLVGRLELRAIHGMLDHYLVGGRFWTHPLPLPVPGRYNVRNQLRKRFLTRLRSHATRA